MSAAKLAEVIQGEQGGGGIAAASAEPGAVGDVFFQVDFQSR